MKDLYPDNHSFPNCSTKEAAFATIDILSKVLFEEYKDHLKKACLLPCQQTIFTAKLQYFHSNSWVSDRITTQEKNSTMFIALRFESSTISEEVENYVYDVPNFLAALGGNLGLLIGCSVLSTLFGLIDFFIRVQNKVLILILGQG